MIKTVLHQHIWKPSMGGVALVTLCNRVRNGGDWNVAETPEQVTCHFCRNILDGKTKSVRMKWLGWTSEQAEAAN